MNNFENNDWLKEFQLNSNALNIESTIRYADPAGRAFTDEWNLELKRRSERINPGEVVRIMSHKFFTNEWGIVACEDNTESTCTLLIRSGKLIECPKAQLEFIELSSDEKASARELMTRIKSLYKKLRNLTIKTNTMASGAFIKGISVKEFPQDLTTVEDCGLRAIESFVD